MVNLFGQGNAARSYQLGVGVLRHCRGNVPVLFSEFVEQVPAPLHNGGGTLREHLARLQEQH